MYVSYKKMLHLKKNHPYKQTKRTTDKLRKNVCKLYHRKKVHIPKI